MKLKKGNDIYDRSSCIRNTFVTLITVWILGYLALGALLTNAHFEVSICDPAGGPCTGQIYSDLGSSVGWIATSMLGLKIFIIAAYQYNLAFGRNRICSTIWIIIMLLIFISQCVSWMLFFSDWVTCNRPGYASNICNDQQKCLVPEFFKDPVANRCPNSEFGARAYTLQLSNLQPRPDFKWLFGAVSLFIVLDFLVILFVGVVWCGISRVSSPVQKKNH